ncbi:MAG: glutamyl-tRNA synthetase [Candidatus Saccharibacteria bacterium]|nr:glutamyl-tRNA synthetase [Candidatus Saccharibacteria bacterium]
MYSPELIERLTALLAPHGYTERQESEAAYPARSLPGGAEVMRVPPSPTGFVHIGTIYAGLINERIAHQTGGVFILRIEDTDKKREVEGSVEGIINAFREFDLGYDEGPDTPPTPQTSTSTEPSRMAKTDFSDVKVDQTTLPSEKISFISSGENSDSRTGWAAGGGAYGPYFQSERGKTYMGYALELLKNSRAYPCFATPEELKAATADQQAKKQRPGYYGDWALWRNKTEADIIAALDAEKPFVLRFRSNGDHLKRIQYTDVFKGKMEVPENDLDVPLIKSDEYRLPTYHLAHVVDDHLMRITKVFRSDEWLPSTALHIELAQALNIEPFTYGHFAPISVIDKNGGGKRKLSKRKDDEANVQYWLEAGYPIEAVKAYLFGLANSNFEDWYRANPGKPVTDFPISLEKLAASRAPLLDMKKLEDYAKDYIASLPQDKFNAEILAWANNNSPRFAAAMEADDSYTNLILSIERDGDKPRKDLAKWSDAPENYSYFFDGLFPEEFISRVSEELKDFPSDVVTTVCAEFMSTYDENDDQQTWFDKLKSAAEKTGFSTDNGVFKESPEKFNGNVADFARIIRVKLTGKNRTPDLWTIMKVMGLERVKNRLQ